MKKRQLIRPAPTAERTDHDWLPLDELAEVEFTSESATHPVEAALLPGGERGWRAAGPGEQTIRLTFEHPLALRHIRVVVEERERARTQEFVLRVAFGPEGSWREVARQQFNFSPSGAVREQEDYRVELPAVVALELTIVPDIGGGDARASVEQLRVA